MSPVQLAPPAVVVGLDLLDASALASGEVEDALKPKVDDARKNKVKLALPASCSKTPLPASGKGKEVAVVPNLSEASAMKTEQKKLKYLCRGFGTPKYKNFNGSAAHAPERCDVVECKGLKRRVVVWRVHERWVGGFAHAMSGGPTWQHVHVAGTHGILHPRDGERIETTVDSRCSYRSH
ncbi:hypothetical protein E2562_014545 [Oryza meyeriana var. granulata]|uniref:Uncharacterized protein n=1 Tax=Oryza meyeriana var. granulata TaxID=110450 RepID=A0A6G1EL94_9ORYZ|nr:hypothetical protein E2562_014545 [Oryza meyeriana var. granulata]